ncbi:MAG TPA: TonB-dependent receptor [Thermoanaerobaculia bacterium]|nr:TonB-dependent receptor [Thermoanaerobaculia bacterium]
MAHLRNAFSTRLGASLLIVGLPLASPVPAGGSPADPPASDPDSLTTFGDTITVQETARPGVAERKTENEIARSPDTQAAEAVARLPGVVAEGELGETDRVLVRGAEARLVATTLDGERVPSPDGEARSAGLSLIPTYLLGEVSVAKTLAPDRDADAIGGTIDLVTRRAPPAGLSALELTGGTEWPSGRPLYGGNLAFGRRLLAGRLGVLTAVTAEDAEREVDGFSARYGGEGLERAETLGYMLFRDRVGALATVDFALSERAGVELRGLYGSHRGRELRRRVKDDVEEGLIERELKDGELWRELLAVSANGSRLFGAALLEASLGYNGAAEREPDRVDTSFVQEEVDFTPESGAGRPVPSNEDPSRFLLDKIGVEDNDTRERNLFAGAGLSWPLKTGRASSAVLKTGAKARDKSKRRDVRTTFFRPEGEVFLLDWTGPLSGSSRGGPMIGPESARRLLASLGEIGIPGQAEETADYQAAERTAAVYAQAEVRLGRLTLLPGVRYEHTRSDYRGLELTAGGEEEPGLRPLRGESSYGMWLPMLHAAFALREGLALHAALTRGFARPDYFDLVPYRLLDAEDLEIEEGNPGLRATRSWNLDGRLDWQAGTRRSISAGIFYRAITDFTFIRRGEIELEGERWDSTRPENGERARLFGAELVARWRLPREEGPLAGWEIEASATWTRSEAWLAGQEETPLFRLPGQAPWTGGLALSRDRGRWAGTLAFTWAGPYLAELGTTREEDLFRAGQRHLDASLSYTFASGPRWRIEARNLTSDPLRRYEGDPGRTVLEESYGRSLRSVVSFGF